MNLPPFRDTALLLDLDGTLLDIAPTPDAVIVPDGLRDTLLTLKRHLAGALAVITGRAIAEIDRLLEGVPHAVGGEHGGAVRIGPGEAEERPELKAPPQTWLEHAARLEAAHPGVMLERKPRGFGLHYRLVPEAGPAIHAALSGLVAGSEDFLLMQGQMLWEVLPRGVDKGTAVTRLMRDPPFLGRIPLFIGDDVTDEDGMRVARAMGGAGLQVREWFGDAAGVRAWLSETAAKGDWGTARCN
jgi:trehalose 6-phosphate phosphatase